MGKIFGTLSSVVCERVTHNHLAVGSNPTTSITCEFAQRAPGEPWITSGAFGKQNGVLVSSNYHQDAHGISGKPGVESGNPAPSTFNGGKMVTDRHEFHNDLEVFCSAQEHKGMALELMGVYGPTATLKDVLASINYQLDKYENLLYTHNQQEIKSVAGAVMSAINDAKTE